MPTSELFDLVPKDLLENLEFRKKLWTRAHNDLQFQADMMKACKEDFCFWLASFVMLYEPRDRRLPDGRPKPPVVPFVPWPHQLPVILDIRHNIGRRDVIVKKSRGEGMSWIGIVTAVHDWLFFPGKKIGLVSRTELMADDPGNMDSLGAKVDWVLQKLPKWMGGVEDVHFKRDRTKHSWVNFRNDSQINAFAATSDTGRAGRYTWFMPDELAFWDRPKDQNFMNAIRGSTDSRLIISTPNGMDGAYYRICTHPGNALVKELSWRDNPSKNQGLYKVIGDKPYLIDPANGYPNPMPPGWRLPDANLMQDLRRKGFKPEGSVRSPWYDNECMKPDSTPRSIAMELDMDFGGSMHKYFFPDFFRKLDGDGIKEGTVQQPLWRGRFDWLKEDLIGTMLPEENGKELKLWCPLSNGRPPAHSYVFGIDISRGEGGDFTSNSVCSIIDLTTMEQVGEWASNTIEPIPFADGCIALAKIFGGAYLIWEHNGPGNLFGKRVLARRYGNVHYRTDDYQRSKSMTGKKKVGWVSGGAKKNTLMDQFRDAVIKSELVVRSADVAKEANEYIIVPNTGEVRHLLAGRSDDDPDQGAAHGDRVIAIALALEGAKERPASSRQVKAASLEKVQVGPNTIGGRMQMAKDAQEKEDEVWDARTNWDLTNTGMQYSPADSIF
jgi:hypothetical protein